MELHDRVTGHGVFQCVLLHDGIRATAIMLRSVAAISSWRSPPSQWSKPQKLHRPPSSEKIRACSDILFDELRGRPHQSLQPSFRALSSRAIFMFPVNSVEKVCFRLVMWKNLHVLSATLRLKFTEHFNFRFCICKALRKGLKHSSTRVPPYTSFVL